MNAARTGEVGAQIQRTAENLTSDPMKAIAPRRHDIAAPVPRIVDVHEWIRWGAKEVDPVIAQGVESGASLRQYDGFPPTGTERDLSEHGIVSGAGW
jgi:hypothetical protein